MKSVKKLCTVAQVTDLHIGRTIAFPSIQLDLYDELLLTVERLQSLSDMLDLVIISGDLSNHGNVPDCRRVKEVLDTLPMPYFVMVGNHDRRSVLREVFSDHTYMHSPGDGYIQYSIEHLPIRIIVLDTLSVGSHRGLLDEARIAWLDGKLSEQPHKPTMICMHHPPFETGMPYPDSLGLDGKEALGQVVRKYHNIEAVVSGHTHRDSVVRWNNTVAYVTPSSSFSYKLEFEEVDDLDPLNNPPAFRIFRWDPAVGLVSHLCYTGVYEFGLSEGVPSPPEKA